MADPEDRARGRRRGSVGYAPSGVQGAEPQLKLELGGQNVLKTFEMAVRHNRRTARTELEFSIAGFIFTHVQKYFLAFLRRGGGNRPHRPPWMRH